MASTIQVRRDTSANWTSVNPTLASGEIGFETNTGKLKIGTGSTAWNSLAYNYDPAAIAITGGTATGLTALATTAACSALLGGAAASAQSSLAILATKTIAVPAAISVWRGLDVQASTLTLTEGGVAPNALNLAHIAAPTITSAAAYTVPLASTLTIAGPPAAAGGVTITVPLAVNVLSGYSSFASRVGVGTTTPLSPLHVVGDAADTNHVTGLALYSGATKVIALEAANGVVGGACISFSAGVGAMDFQNYRMVSTSGTYDLVFQTKATGGAAYTRLSLTGNANVSNALFINCNVSIGATSVGASAANCLVLTNAATAPSASANLVHLYSADIAADRATLAIWQEEAVAADIALVSASSLTVYINGTRYKLMLAASA